MSPEVTNSLMDSGTTPVSASLSTSAHNYNSFNHTIAAAAAAETNMTEVTEVTRFDECNPELASCQAQRILFMVFGPLLLLMSVVGGSLGVAVMTRKSLRRTASAVFIASLSVSDMLAVLTGLIRHFTLKVSEIDVRKLNAISCKSHRFILYLSLDTSAWILIAICVERFLAVCLPHYHRILKTPSRAAMVVGAILAFMFCFNFPVWFIWGEQVTIDGNTTSIRTCGFTSLEAKTYWTSVHHYLALTIYCIIPFITMLALNILIIYKLSQMNNLAKRSSSKSRSQKRKLNTSSMTTMLLCVTFYFIIVTTPSFIFTLIQEQMFNDSAVSEEKHANMELVDAILTIMLYINHSINFFLYCLTGRRFRSELRALLLNCLAKARIVSATSAATSEEEFSRATTYRKSLHCSTTEGETSKSTSKNGTEAYSITAD